MAHKRFHYFVAAFGGLAALLLAVILVLQVAPVESQGKEEPAKSEIVDTVDDAAGKTQEPHESSPAPGGYYRWPQQVLWDNGPLVNCEGCGAGGADESVLQNTTLGMSELGFDHQMSLENWVADDFRVSNPEGWVIDKITFFAYQDNSPITSTITDTNWIIYDGDPSNGGSPVGESSGLDETTWSNIYRVTETTSGSVNRPVMANEVRTGGIYLSQGEHWLAWQTDGELASGPWAPPITISGVLTTGNGLQSLDDKATWNPALDTNTGARQGFPFILEGVPSGYLIDDSITFDFEDISSTGTEIILVDDETSDGIPLGFDFKFYGRMYSETHISSNGLLAMPPGQPSPFIGSRSIPNITEPNGIIAGWWEDLDPTGGNGQIHYQVLGSSPDRRFIVQFTDVEHFPSGNPSTFQFKLYERSDYIEVHYQSALSDGSTHSAGVENHIGQVGAQYVLTTTNLSTPLAVRYTPTAPNIEISPAQLQVEQPVNLQVSLPISVTNLGQNDLQWTFDEESSRAGQPSGEYVAGSHALSIGPAPNDSPLSPLEVTPSGAAIHNAYGWNSQNGPYYTVFDPADPTILPNTKIFPAGDNFVGAGEYSGGTVYMIDTAHNLYVVDAATGTTLDDYSATTPPLNETYSGLALDPTDGTMYAASTSVFTSTLSTIDPSTGIATVIGEITNAPAIIGIAIDGTGTLYGYDIGIDSLLSIDKATGTGTIIGSIGFDANFGQGIGWDPTTDSLIMAAFNNETFQAEMRIVDRATGNTTFAGVMGGDDPGGLNQISWLGFDDPGFCEPSDIPWASVTPNSGTTSGNSTDVIDVMFDTTGLAAGVYEGIFCVESNDAAEPILRVPVEMTVGYNTMLPFMIRR